LQKFVVVFLDLISQNISKCHSSVAQQYELQLEEVKEQLHQEDISPAVIAQCEAAELKKITKIFRYCARAHVGSGPRHSREVYDKGKEEAEKFPTKF